MLNFFLILLDRHPNTPASLRQRKKRPWPNGSSLRLARLLLGVASPRQSQAFHLFHGVFATQQSAVDDCTCSTVAVWHRARWEILFAHVRTRTPRIVRGTLFTSVT